METGYIRMINIENGQPDFEIGLANGTVWMTANEIADLFGVHTSTITKHLKRIFKEKFLREGDVMKEYRYTCSKNRECIRIYYNLEIIICLSFRIQSVYTQAFRKWIIHVLNNHHGKEKAPNTFVICNIGGNDYSLLNLN